MTYPFVLGKSGFKILTGKSRSISRVRIPVLRNQAASEILDPGFRGWPVIGFASVVVIAAAFSD